jgi:solute carrier family 35 (UDP-sugar transporter), member A1/2/3
VGLVLLLSSLVSCGERSLMTLAIQNAALTIIMHTSRTTIPPSRQYSAASAVLLNELLKGSISLAIAVSRVEPKRSPFRRVARDVFSPDCWKLAIPAILYVVQNNLQYVAASNLDAATFQVTYQMKILTTAAFSVLLLRKQLTPTKWLALFFLAVGVGIVQIQSGGGSHAKHIADTNTMNPLLGFFAVTAACFTSGLAGVYFEMVLKNSQADLWVRNVQLSLFSLLPALLPALLETQSSFPSGLFRNFGLWAWATVLTQVLGGLITAIVIKYADNILKGFATSLSIVISFVASVILFDFTITLAFVVGACVVLGSTWLYNQPAAAKDAAGGAGQDRPSLGLSVTLSRSSKPGSALGSPVEANAPILGQPTSMEIKRASLVGAFSVLGLSRTPSPSPSRSHSPRPDQDLISHPIYTPPPTRPSSPRPSSRLSTASAQYTIGRPGSSMDVSRRNDA